MMAGRTSQLRMSFDPSKVPVTKSVNPNIDKSQAVIDAQIAADKAKQGKVNSVMQKKFERNFNKWREYDLLTCLIACVGLALAMVDWEYTRISAYKIATEYDPLCE